MGNCLMGKSDLPACGPEEKLFKEMLDELREKRVCTIKLIN